MAKIAAVIIVLALLVGLSTQQEKQQFCGRRLANALSLLCVHGMLLEKRTGPNEVQGGLVVMNYGRQPWTPESARPMDRVTRGRRIGIIEECCDNACSIDQLMDYCKPADV